ncbi:tRNA threonylcarbamoyladenosine biosynthesis protein TsaE [Nymphon striatum]|nr:tRNA threonylcarbamoyladenosine biosynthesis protein TsaE [Nymphon striatum]
MDPLVSKTASEEESTKLGSDIAMVLREGDFLCLSGNLGVGKSVLARSIIRHLADDENFDVPSPTYTLCQSYETSPAIAHFDLYRLSSMDELEELGWEDALETGCVIMEWPERCFDEIPTEAVHIEISDLDEPIREFKFSGNSNLLNRISEAVKSGTS